MKEIHGGDVYSKEIEYDFSVNINPLGFPDCFEAVFDDYKDELIRYPEYDSTSLKEALAEHINVDVNRIVITAGASEAFVGLCRSDITDGYVMTPSFFGYEYALNSVDAKIHRINIAEELFQITNYNNSVVFIANPNNPDGKIMDCNSIESIISHVVSKGGSVIVDESFLPLTNRYNETMIGKALDDNVYIVRSFTKTFAIPGIRLGYVVCKDEMSAMKLKRKLPEWNVSSFAIKIGLKALESYDYLAKARQIIDVERRYLEESFDELGLNYIKSSANYILFRGPKKLKEKLINKRILIRDCSNYYGLGEGYYRVAVKTHDENALLVEALRECI